MEISRHWRLKAQRYRLIGSACSTCGKVMFPPRPVYPRCIPQPAQVVRSGFPYLAAPSCKLDKSELKGR